MSALYWLSFCDTAKAEGSQFLGVAIVRAPDPVHAAVVAAQLGCNPGGEVLITRIEHERLVRREWMNRLLCVEEIEALERGLRS